MMNVGDLRKLLESYGDETPLNIIAVAKERLWASQIIMVDEHNSGTALADNGPTLVVYEKPEYVELSRQRNVQFNRMMLGLGKE